MCISIIIQQFTAFPLAPLFVRHLSFSWLDTFVMVLQNSALLPLLPLHRLHYSSNRCWYCDVFTFAQCWFCFFVNATIFGIFLCWFILSFFSSGVFMLLNEWRTILCVLQRVKKKRKSSLYDCLVETTICQTMISPSSPSLSAWTCSIPPNAGNKYSIIIIMIVASHLFSAKVCVGDRWMSIVMKSIQKCNEKTANNNTKQ